MSSGLIVPSGTKVLELFGSDMVPTITGDVLIPQHLEIKWNFILLLLSKLEMYGDIKYALSEAVTLYAVAIEIILVPVLGVNKTGFPLVKVDKAFTVLLIEVIESQQGSKTNQSRNEVK
jgi:hypothetical protein